jgi:hypothetical protein
MVHAEPGQKRQTSCAAMLQKQAPQKLCCGERRARVRATALIAVLAGLTSNRAAVAPALLEPRWHGEHRRLGSLWDADDARCGLRWVLHRAPNFADAESMDGLMFLCLEWRCMSHNYARCSRLGSRLGV